MKDPEKKELDEETAKVKKAKELMKNIKELELNENELKHIAGGVECNPECL